MVWWVPFRLDCGILGSQSLCNSFVYKMNTSSHFFEDILTEYLTIPTIRDIVLGGEPDVTCRMRF